MEGINKGVDDHLARLASEFDCASVLRDFGVASMLMFLCCVFFPAIGQGNLSLLWRSRLLASPRLWKESPLLWKESFKGEGIDIDRLVRFDSPQLRAKVSGPHCLILGPWLRPGEANRDTVFASPTVSLASPFGPGSTRQCGGNGGGLASSHSDRPPHMQTNTRAPLTRGAATLPGHAPALGPRS